MNLDDFCRLLEISSSKICLPMGDCCERGISDEEAKKACDDFDHNLKKFGITLYTDDGKCKSLKVIFEEIAGYLYNEKVKCEE